jgi:hypothetical protein
VNKERDMKADLILSKMSDNRHLSIGLSDLNDIVFRTEHDKETPGVETGYVTSQI